MEHGRPGRALRSRFEFGNSHFSIPLAPNPSPPSTGERGVTGSLQGAQIADDEVDVLVPQEFEWRHQAAWFYLLGIAHPFSKICFVVFDHARGNGPATHEMSQVWETISP